MERSGISRRAFIGSAAALSAGSYLLWRFGVLAPSSKGAEGIYLIGNVKKKAEHTGLATVSAAGEKVQYWRIPVISHSAVQNPSRPWQIVSVEKRGTRAAFVDTRFADSTRVIQAPKDLEFYGHGFFSQDGSRAFLSAQHPKKLNGYVLIYDSITLNLLETLDSGGFRPHELQVDKENPDLFLIANSGTPKNEANISWISITSGKIVRQVGVSIPGMAPAHFNQTAEGDILFTGSDNDYELEADHMSFGYFRRDFERVEIVSGDWGKKWKGEALNSFVDHENKRIWLTLPNSDCVLVVDKDKKNLIKEIPNIAKARSIVPIVEGGKRMVTVSHHRATDDRGDQIVFDLDSMEVVLEPRVKPYGFYSIHASAFVPWMEKKG